MLKRSTRTADKSDYKNSGLGVRIVSCACGSDSYLTVVKPGNTPSPASLTAEHTTTHRAGPARGHP
ncbi:hypothetical protein E2C01_032441 [Portunus trituberculatus]|uniref:Uncharacterized protein n=1 Tax=Portunus trituberculatus TaxID=210409 RepID=A0A5B7F1D8_PORTR|nr:hypothetical protein [Portunus trituberculatus]